jgi:hypothetical protein
MDMETVVFWGRVMFGVVGVILLLVWFMGDRTKNGLRVAGGLSLSCMFLLQIYGALAR